MFSKDRRIYKVELDAVSSVLSASLFNEFNPASVRQTALRDLRVGLLRKLTEDFAVAM